MVAAALAAGGCSTAPRTSEQVSARRGDLVPVCNGSASVDVNNTGNIPVDVYASYDVGNDALLGTVQPGHARFGLTRTPVSGFFTRRVGDRTILEATSDPHPGADRVQYKTACSGA
jgi:hypothetical protein